MRARTSSPSRDATSLIVACVGGLAASAIAEARDGCVRAVFERSAYVELGGHWLCMGARDLGRGPLNALVGSNAAIRAWLARVRPGEPVAGSWPRFRVGGAELDFASALRWHPAKPALPIDRGRLAHGVIRMRSAARSRVPAEGLAFLVAGTDPSSVLARIGRDASGALHDWLAQPNAAPPHTLAALIGLGPGLTPSGDDFLGGALVALHAFGNAGLAKTLGDWLLPLCANATHPVSAAHVAAAARGEGGEALHACLCALADGRDANDALDAIAAVGHTSGWDALAGAMTVASATSVVVSGCAARARRTRPHARSMVQR